MTTDLLVPPTCSQGIPLIVIPHMHQNFLIQLCDTPTKTATHMSDCKYLWVPLRVLASLFTTRMFLCECWQVHMRVFSSLTLTSFDSHVGNASLVCTRTHESLIIACDIVSDVNHLHSFVNLHLSGPVAHTQLTFTCPSTAHTPSDLSSMTIIWHTHCPCQSCAIAHVQPMPTAWHCPCLAYAHYVM